MKKTKNPKAPVVLIICFVLGLASCSYDDELQPSRRTVEPVTVNSDGTVAGKNTVIEIKPKLNLTDQE